MGKGNAGGNRSIYWGYSAIMEWTLVFFFGLMFFIIASDLRLKSYGDPVKWMIQSESNGSSNKEAHSEFEENEMDWDPIDDYHRHQQEAATEQNLHRHVL